MLTYKIHLIRHGLTQANFEQRYIGVTDQPLCDEGIARLSQLRDTREYPFTQLVYSSPLLRAVQTAELLYPDAQVETLDTLRELDFGAFENRTAADLDTDPEFRAWIASPDRPTPGGESGAQAAERAVRGLTSIFSQMMEEKITSAAVITHGGIMSSLLCMLGLPQREAIFWQCAPGEGYTLLLTPQMWMRDQKFEVYAKIPYSPEMDEADADAMWHDLADEGDEDWDDENWEDED